MIGNDPLIYITTFIIHKVLDKSTSNVTFMLFVAGHHHPSSPTCVRLEDKEDIFQKTSKKKKKITHLHPTHPSTHTHALPWTQTLSTNKVILTNNSIVIESQ